MTLGSGAVLAATFMRMSLARTGNRQAVKQARYKAVKRAIHMQRSNQYTIPASRCETKASMQCVRHVFTRANKQMCARAIALYSCVCVYMRARSNAHAQSQFGQRLIIFHASLCPSRIRKA
eukprot:7542490-Pyramimonas_sp.AAC.1